MLWSSPAQVVNGRTTLHHWTDGSNANPRVFAGLTENAIFTGVFVPASLLTPDVQCRDPQGRGIACPSSPGRVTFYGVLPGASVISTLNAQPNDFAITGFFPVGSLANAIAAANNGFTFVAWITGAQSKW